MEIDMSEDKLGNIINDELYFLTLNVSATIQTGDLHCEVNYDSRIIKDEKAIKQLTKEYIQNIDEFLSHK
jgi:hypothetical protein